LARSRHEQEQPRAADDLGVGQDIRIKIVAEHTGEVAGEDDSVVIQQIRAEDLG
jgi:hypothetical protein